MERKGDILEQAKKWQIKRLWISASTKEEKNLFSSSVKEAEDEEISASGERARTRASAHTQNMLASFRKG